MKANRETDELLCSFIDGELPLRQQTEVQRLVARDPEVAQRLRQLQNCKNLVSVLPRAEAPGEMLEQIRVSLERRTLLEDRPMSSASRAGARHLKIRRFVAAAAMIALVGGLAAVVYQILAPVSPPGPGVFVATANDPTLNVAIEPVAGFSGRLELRTAAFAQADAFVKARIEDNGLSDFSESETVDGARVYRVDCSREGANRLVADLGTIWQNFQSATLSVDTERFADPVVIEPVTLQQTAQIINQDSADACVAVAEDVAVLNRFAREMPGREILSTTDDALSTTVPLPRIPRPVFTSADPATRRTLAPPEGKVKASLIIVLLNTQ